jgi:hypothetical protein
MRKQFRKFDLNESKCHLKKSFGIGDEYSPQGHISYINYLHYLSQVSRGKICQTSVVTVEQQSFSFSKLPIMEKNDKNFQNF